MRDENSKIDIIEYLSRNDKWTLGGGTALLWAPTHPQWLHHLGFWDGSHYYSYEFRPVFTTTLLDERERVLTPKFVSRKWNPAFLTHIYNVTGKITLIEKKTLLPNDSLVSEVTLKNNSTVPQRIQLIMWTGQPTSFKEGGRSLLDITCDGQRISFRKNLRASALDDYDVFCSMGMNRKVASHCITASQKVPNHPRWEYTPFYEKFRDRGFPQRDAIRTIAQDELLYMALHTSLELNPHARKSVTFAANISRTPEETSSRLAETVKSENPIKQSIESWREFFERVPYLECSDKHIQKYYWYRWYGLKLCTVSGDEKAPHFPAVCEGPADFHTPSPQSAQVHMREAKWMDTPEMAQGCFLSFLPNKTVEGVVPSPLIPNAVKDEDDFYVNWGECLLELNSVHPNSEFLEEAYDSLAKYTHDCDGRFDHEGSSLYDIRHHFPIGPQFPRRCGARPGTDNEEYEGSIRLKGVDATVEAYGLKKVLAIVAGALGRVEEGKEWEEAAGKMKRAILDIMWDPADEMFYDVDPQTMARTKVKAVTCFYTYTTDIVEERHIQGLKRHVLNPEEFWTPHPVASLSKDNNLFNPEGQWRGRRYRRPWNGRVWPIANCHLIDALAYAGNCFDESLKPKAVELMTAFLHMMFMKDDVRFPNSYEHYNPVSGAPSLYRGLDDVQHSWMVDLILKYVAGIQPQRNGMLVVDPLPFGIQWLRVDRVPIRGHLVRVEIDGEDISLYVDDVLRSSGKRGAKVELDVTQFD